MWNQFGYSNCRQKIENVIEILKDCTTFDLQVINTKIVRNSSSKMVGLKNDPNFSLMYGNIICIGTKNCRAYVKHIPKPAASLTA